jgi:hypothetical protein
MEEDNTQSVQNILDIDFKKVGYWKLNNVDELELVKNDENSFIINNVLYAFVLEGEADDLIKYIGKTTQSLSKRFVGYAKPGKDQQTNFRVNKKIMHELKNNKKIISIWSFKDIEPLKWGQFNLNLASGLEDSLVYNVSPEWNKAGKKAITSTEEMEIEDLDLSLDGTINYEFQIVLGKTYYNLGYMNPGTKISEFMGGEGEIVELKIDNQLMTAKINRTANFYGAVRLNFGKDLALWYQENFKLGDRVKAILEVNNDKSLIKLKK